MNIKNSTKAIIILSTEAVFGCIFGVLFHHDPITLPLCVGFSLVMASVLLSQLWHKPATTD